MKIGDLGQRILVAIPLAIFACVLVALGGWPFAIGLFVLGCICIHELCELSQARRPIRLAAFITMALVAVAAQAGGAEAVLAAAWASVPITFALIALRTDLQGAADSVYVTVFAVVWIALGFGHAVLLRELPHGGGIVLDALIATFAMDTGAYLGGRAFGTRPLAPRISPRKTVEGLLAGIAATILAVFAATLYQDWLGAVDALAIALIVAGLAPMGDLFESMIKRDSGAKDASTVLGPHGGLLDRLDGVLFSIVGVYWLWFLIV